jgi:hypothetical protein
MKRYGRVLIPLKVQGHGACRIKFDVPTIGLVPTVSERINCQAGATCNVNVSDSDFDEVVVAGTAPIARLQDNTMQPCACSFTQAVH